MTTTTIEVPGAHTGCPTWFRASCWEASQGGVNGYYVVGRRLLATLVNECPMSLEDDEWLQAIDTLEDHLTAGDVTAAHRWLETRLPLFMRKVPRERREAFMRGVADEHREHGIER